MPDLVLPAPTPEAQEAAKLLQQRIRDRIAEDGSISFAEFMELALYAPGLGYYESGRRLFGRGGDFVTAAELGPLYARTLARAVAPVLRGLEDPEVLEVGPGSGNFAADFWAALRAEDVPLTRYGLLERSERLRDRQVETLEKRARPHLPRTVWLEEPPTVGWNGVVICNEVFDALPVHVYQRRGAAFDELRVGWRDGGFAFVPEPASGELARWLAGNRIEVGDGHVGEVALGAPKLLSAISDRLLRGLVLVADYGASRAELLTPERARGTLVAHYRMHMLEDPLSMPGLCDLSASVDFTGLAQAGAALGLELAAYDAQGPLLLAAGLPELAGDLERMPDGERLRLSRCIQMLTRPDAMGERFKILALARGLDLASLGRPFDLPGQRYRL